MKAASATVAAMTQGFTFGFHAFIAAFAADESEVVVAILLQIPLRATRNQFDRCTAEPN
jgi:hypothetical protein